MTEHVRAWLERTHGLTTVVLPPDVVDEDGRGVVLAFGHRDRPAAEAYAAANRDEWGHPSRAELREAVGWVCVIDLRPAIAAARLDADHLDAIEAERVHRARLDADQLDAINRLRRS